MRLETLYHDARKNEQVLKKFQQLELRLLSCSSLVELMQIITHQSRSTFGWDTLTIILHDKERQIYKLLKGRRGGSRSSRSAVVATRHLAFTPSF